MLYLYAVFVYYFVCVCLCVICYFFVFWGCFPLQLSPSVLWYCWLGLLTCKNRLPYNLYCVGGVVKHCSIQFNSQFSCWLSVASSRMTCMWVKWRWLIDRGVDHWTAQVIGKWYVLIIWCIFPVIWARLKIIQSYITAAVAMMMYNLII